MTVLLYRNIRPDHLRALLQAYGMEIKIIGDNENIPGSFWRAPEAGLVGNTLYIRNDTPLHSALHEACHYICMDAARRKNLDTDAGGGYQEEDAVCYLQILLADFIPEMKQPRMFSDMDEWGYSFRLGSAKAWFEQDAEDARDWLLTSGIINKESRPSWQLRH